MPGKGSTRRGRSNKSEQSSGFAMNQESGGVRGKRGARSPQRSGASTNRRSELGWEPGKAAAPRSGRGSSSSSSTSTRGRKGTMGPRVGGRTSTASRTALSPEARGEERGTRSRRGVTTPKTGARKPARGTSARGRATTGNRARATTGNRGRTTTGRARGTRRTTTA